MPSTSIDTFFACTLIVSVAIVATVFAAGNMQTQIDALQNKNEQDYLQTIADSIVFSPGTPEDWGSTGLIPQDFGLSAHDSPHPFELDIDKITRLSSRNDHALSYLQIMKASRLGVAFGVTVSQMLSVNIQPSGNVSGGGFTTYSFVVTVSKDTVPMPSLLNYYVLASSYLENASVATSDTGDATVSFQLPDSSGGNALLIVFARADIDSRMTSVEVYSFGHLDGNPQPNLTFLRLSPLNQSLTVTSHSQETSITRSLALSFSYASDIIATSNSTFDIPRFRDSSPILLVLQGLNGTSSFAEWTTYPQLPNQTGADFSRSTTNVFDYLVTIDGTFYKLRLNLGDFAT